MKITDAIISAILKKGIIYEARNFEADVEIPETKIKARITIEHMTVKIEKEEK